jgi:hypothetical protein
LIHVVDDLDLGDICMKNHNTKNGRMLALLACALLVLGVIAGCAPAKKADTLTPEKKAMVESVAKWYVAQGALDLAGFKAGIYDPNDVLGVASMTAPPKDAKKSEVKWAWVGDAVVLTIASDQTTVTLTPSSTATDVVSVSDTNGSAGKFIMINQNGVWKIDVNKTQEAAAAASQSASGSAPASGTP